MLDSEDVTLLLRSSEKCGCQSGRTRRGCCYKVSSPLLPFCVLVCAKGLNLIVRVELYTAKSETHVIDSNTKNIESSNNLLLQTNSEGVEMKELYFSYLAILRKVANHVALLQSTAGTSKKQVESCRPLTDLL